MKSALEKIKYTPGPGFQWRMPSQIRTTLSKDDICEICDSIKDKEIENLKKESRKLKKLVEFLKTEIHSLELKTALSEKAVPLKKIIKEFTSTPAGRTAWQKAWDERADEWKKLVQQGKMSRITYYRLLNGMDQATLAKKLGTAQPNICRIEKPGYNVPIKTLEKLAKIFKVKKGELIGD
ncbi:MAG: helix-turn-helix transcriptional regulator [Nitrospirae bacterium]|nr:helix-turn-helix transcriptional regulator [Nitrospirota bacterium]